MNFYQEVYEVVKRIPYGKVATYGQIAKIMGCPHKSQQVGWALHANKLFKIVPCHRVVNRFGELSGGFAFGGIEVQKSLLEKEGINVSESFTVDLTRYLWLEYQI